MKKMTLFFSMMLLMLPLLAQEQPDGTSFNVESEIILPVDVVTSIDNIDATFTTVYNDVKEAISGLADGLQVGGEHVYQVLIKQQRIIAWLWFLSLPFMIVFSILFRKCLQAGHRGYLEQIPKESCPDWYIKDVIFSALTGMIMMVALLAFFLTMSDGLTGFINPEYGAIQEILELIK